MQVKVQMGVGKICDFRLTCRYISETEQTMDMITMEHVIYLTVIICNDSAQTIQHNRLFTFLDLLHG